MNGTVEIVQGDITRIPADAIVNAANAQLLAGSGVCGAIFRAAGVEDLTRACAAIGGCATGSAVATPAFGIRTARIIVHAVGPVFANHTPDDARRLLRSAYASAMVCAHEHDCTSIAFPAISTGIYGYPLMEAAAVAAEVCRVESARLGLAVKLVAFDARTADALRLAVCG